MKDVGKETMVGGECGHKSNNVRHLFLHPPTGRSAGLLAGHAVRLLRPIEHRHALPLLPLQLLAHEIVVVHNVLQMEVMGHDGLKKDAAGLD